jgi:hypothetical protein
MMPKTCWDKYLRINIRLVASCWFSLHLTFTMHGHMNVKFPDQWVVVTGHYIDCTVPAQYTNLAWLNPHSDRANGDNKFLWRAGIHLWDCGVTTHNSSFQTIIQLPVMQFITCPGWILILQCSLCSSDSLEKKTRNISSSLSRAAQLGSYSHLSFFPTLQEITLNHTIVQSHSMHTKSHQTAQTQGFPTLGFLFQFQNSHNWWVFGRGKAKHPLHLVFGQL